MLMKTVWSILRIKAALVIIHTDIRKHETAVILDTSRLVSGSDGYRRVFQTRDVDMTETEPTRRTASLIRFICHRVIRDTYTEKNDFVLGTNQGKANVIFV